MKNATSMISDHFKLNSAFEITKVLWNGVAHNFWVILFILCQDASFIVPGSKQKLHSMREQAVMVLPLWREPIRAHTSAALILLLSPTPCMQARAHGDSEALLSRFFLLLCHYRSLKKKPTFSIEKFFKSWCKSIQDRYLYIHGSC